MKQFNLYPKGLLRFSILDHKKLNEMLSDIDQHDYTFLSDPIIQKSLLIGNPDFLKFLQKNELILEKKTEITLAKYLIRMCATCTPFGMFAGSTIINFANHTDVRIDDFKNHSIVTRMSFAVFFQIFEKFEKDENVRLKSLFYLNPTIHSFALNNTIRFLKFIFCYNTLKIKQNMYELKLDEYLELFLKIKEPVKYQELVKILVEKDVEMVSAMEYINSLIETGFLMNNLYPSVEDVNFFKTFCEKIKLMQLEDSAKVRAIQEIEQCINKLNTLSINDNIVDYNNLIRTLIKDSFNFSNKNIFHVDLKYKMKGNQINREIGRKIISGISRYNHFAKKSTNIVLHNFIETFKRRFGESQVNLNYFFDRDLGIDLFFGDATYSDNNESVFKDVVLERSTEENPDLSLPNISNEILQSIIAGKTIDLTLVSEEPMLETDLISCSILFADRNLKNDSPIIVKNIGESGFSNILGRFNYLDSDFFTFHRDLEKLEDSFLKKDNVEVVDLLHFPSVKSSNITVSHRHRNRKISIFSNSDGVGQIDINDLVLQVVNDKLVLIDVVGKCEIVPKLSNAHSFLKSDNCQIYTLLALVGLQSYNSRSLDISIFLKLFGVFPRISYNNVILLPKTWLISLDVKKMSQQELLSYFMKNNLPNVFYLSTGVKNDLLINLNFDICKNVFIDTVKNVQHVLIKEYVWTSNDENIFELFCDFVKNN